MRSAALAAALLAALAPARAAPSFDCARVEAGSIAARVCGDAELSRLDRQLADVFAAALQQARNERPPTLRAEQRGWIKGRDDCWKSPDVGACVAQSYQRRVAELQARYRLLPPTGPVRYACQGNPLDELLLTAFATEPATLVAERGDSTSLMFREAAPGPGGEVVYTGRNESVRMQGADRLALRWGAHGADMPCVKQP